MSQLTLERNVIGQIISTDDIIRQQKERMKGLLIELEYHNDVLLYFQKRKRDLINGTDS